ncbi:MAG: hypothetical protein ACREJ3_00130, partial [Polyangiaceae bacterium]
FYIDVLFWVDGTTAIHQHGFSGAFHVMAGASLQSTYRFAQRRRYSEHLMTGDLDLLGVELLTKGDVRPIASGRALVHSLFHLDRPSVSVVVRTPSDVLAGPQYSYSRAGIAFDPFTKTESTERKIQTLDLLRALDSPEFEPLARATVRSADAFSAFQILTHLRTRIEPHEKYIALLESVRPAHAELIDRIAAHADEERRDGYIILRRKLVKQPEHRFFLALLLNLPDRAHILDMVRRAFPERPPVDTVLAWLAEIEKIDAVHAWVTEMAKGQATPILDVRLDARALAALRRILEGDSPRDMGDDAIVSLAQLQRSMLLRPLLSPCP